MPSTVPAATVNETSWSAQNSFASSRSLASGMAKKPLSLSKRVSFVGETVLARRIQ
jgi:hypothetical protein